MASHTLILEDSQSAGNYGSVTYQMTPDFKTRIYPDSSIKVSGSVRCTAFDVRSIEISLPAPTGTDTFSAVKKLNVAKNVTGSFSVTFMPPQSFFENMKKREITSENSLDITVYGTGNNVAYTYDTSSDTKPLFCKYHLTPGVSADSTFIRTNSSSVAQNDGTYITCTCLKLTKNSQATVSDFTKITLNGKDIMSTVASAAFSATGYKDSGSSRIYSSILQPTAHTTLTLVVGDDDESITKTWEIPRAFANMHLSSAKNGGVAFGQFSSATDQYPRFECAYPAFFSKGLILTPGETKNTGNGQLMMTGIRFGRHKFSKTVAASGRTDETITLSPAFSSDKYVVLLTPMGEGYVDCLYKTWDHHASYFKIRYMNNAAAGTTPVMAWLAIEGSADDSSDLTEG